MIEIKNYWTDLVKDKEIFNKIDEKIVDAWADDLTIGDLLNSFSKEELDAFYRLKIVDCGLEKTESIIDISIKLPNFEGY